MKFKYKIQNKEHEIIEGTADAPDKFFLAREFREKGSTPLLIKELNSKGGLLSINIDFLSSVSLSEKIIFTNNLSGMLQAGLPLTRALTVLEKQSKNVMLNDILTSIVDDVNKGNSLSVGMEKFPKVFSKIFISMVRAGEESGGLPQALSDIGLNLKKSYDLNKKIKSAMMYPSIILGAIVLIAVLMMIYVVPTLTQVFKDLGADLPASTKFIIWLSDSISQNIFMTFLILIAIVGLGLFFAKAKMTQKYFDFIIVRLPVVGTIVKEMNSARTARTLSSLLSSGVDMSKALLITEEVLQNMYYKNIIKNAIADIQKGVPLSKSFKDNTNLYPVMVGEMIEVGEETGKLASMLIDVATFYESEVDNKTKDLSTIIEPVLMVFIGGAVGFFAISMISPMYAVMDSIQ